MLLSGISKEFKRSGVNGGISKEGTGLPDISSNHGSGSEWISRRP